MKEFVVVTDAEARDFSINNMPGTGRYDLIARCIREALWLSGYLREAAIHVVLRHKVLTATPEIRNISPDERSIGLWLKKVFSGQHNPGMRVYEKDRFWDNFTNRNCYLLDAPGKSVKTVQFKPNPVFILGGHKGLTEKVPVKAEKVSLGKKEYLASQCITILNWLLD